MLFFVCMFVCLYVCHPGCWMSRKEVQTFNNVYCHRLQSNFNAVFTVCHRKKRTFQRSAEMSTISLAGATMFDGIRENFEKFSKKLTKKFVSTTSTISRQHIIKASSKFLKKILLASSIFCSAFMAFV